MGGEWCEVLLGERTDGHGGVPLRLKVSATELYVEIYGERARPTTVVLVDEVVDGGWGVAGNVLTAAMLNGDA